MENIEKLMERKNAEYYSGRGKHIYYDFKTFAASKKLGKACAIEFMECAQKVEGELRVYEIGVGGGDFALTFLKNLKQIDPTISKEVTYVLWDMSNKLLDEAEDKLRNFAVEKVHARAEETSKMKDAFWIRGNEILDDVPARVFLRKKEKVYEIGGNNGEWCAEEAPAAPKAVREYMRKMPEEYWIPLNLHAAKLIESWEKQMRKGGRISMLDYGFAELGEIKEPLEIWNDSVIRKYGGEYTVDVNFDFLLKQTGGQVEPQGDFVNAKLGEDSFAVEKSEGMDYLNSSEIEAERKNLEKEGYDIDLLKRGKESTPYFHYFISA